jgi:hypothetical protein
MVLPHLTLPEVADREQDDCNLADKPDQPIHDG